MGLEAALELGAVGALHDEDDVGPFDKFRGACLLRIRRQAGGGGLDAWVMGEDLLGRGGAEAVAGAEEEEVGHPTVACKRTILNLRGRGGWSGCVLVGLSSSGMITFVLSHLREARHHAKHQKLKFLNALMNIV
jgi:hypothetical protein